jgi:hypothetical protein
MTAMMTLIAVARGITQPLRASEKDILMELYWSTNGLLWKNNAGWRDGSDPCMNAWFGVACAAGSDVVGYGRCCVFVGCIVLCMPLACRGVCMSEQVVVVVVKQLVGDNSSHIGLARQHWRVRPILSVTVSVSDLCSCSCPCPGRVCVWLCVACAVFLCACLGPWMHAMSVCSRRASVAFTAFISSYFVVTAYCVAVVKDELLWKPPARYDPFHVGAVENDVSTLSGRLLHGEELCSRRFE